MKARWIQQFMLYFEIKIEIVPHAWLKHRLLEIMKGEIESLAKRLKLRNSHIKSVNQRGKIT